MTHPGAPKVVVVRSANADLILGSDVVTTPGARAHDGGTRVVGDCGLPRPDGVVAVDRVGVARETRAAEAATAQLFVRTGEATTYANAILRCGVPF